MSSDVHLPTGQTINPDAQYTLAELAEFFRATERQARRWVDEGRIAFTRKPGGRGVVIPGSAIIEAIRAGYTEKDAPDRVARRHPTRRKRKAATRAAAAATGAEEAPTRARSRRTRPPSGQIVA